MQFFTDSMSLGLFLQVSEEVRVLLYAMNKKEQPSYEDYAKKYLR